MHYLEFQRYTRFVCEYMECKVQILRILSIAVTCLRLHYKSACEQ